MSAIHSILRNRISTILQKKYADEFDVSQVDLDLIVETVLEQMIEDIDCYQETIRDEMLEQNPGRSACGQVYQIRDYRGDHQYA